MRLLAARLTDLLFELSIESPLARSKTSSNWLKEHFDDPYVKQAQKDGYRSRASYKLLEISKKDRLLRPGMTVVDLGAAPGGWTQVAMQLVGEEGTVVASDILAMDSIADVTFVQGDFNEQAVYDQIVAALGGEKADLVISDMAPNLSGNKAVDQPAVIYLAELALELAGKVLTSKGVFIAKLFQGQGFDPFVLEVRKMFNGVSIIKPEASRSRSREVYLVAKGLKAN